jgi:hypothetical protein
MAFVLTRPDPRPGGNILVVDTAVSPPCTRWATGVPMVAVVLTGAEPVPI